MQNYVISICSQDVYDPLEKQIANKIGQNSIYFDHQELSETHN